MNEDKEKLYSIYLNEKLNLIFDIDDSKDETIESSYPQIISYRTNDYHKRCYLEDKEGNQIGNYYEEIRDFSEGYAAVKFEDSFTYNFIDKNGKLLSEDRYTGVGNFKNGYAWVERSEKPSYNFIDKNGGLICDEWYDYVSSFDDECSDADGKLSTLTPFSL